ncbi:arsenic transporter [Nitrospirillum pindoramense]|uniref:Arsenite efflux membrane protein ArsB n=1 Tax=Nitrospirillum amazonense TaxID=28077 RepID=A0A560GYH2_9PROT|nr:arsenic transporter [Nitrospirillum amazonense]TWB39085.1 arsenite efflux membrane protein ArsB [Nitrospirillum amazonense]
MPAVTLVEGGIWTVAAVTTGGVIVRPWRLPEAVWAMAGAATLVATALVPWRQAWGAVAEGSDLYLFLIGMMMLAELARQEGLFDWLAAIAVNRAGGSGGRLFTQMFLIGVAVTAFLSNDATAVVLTPAVYAAVRAAGATPAPYLFACAFVANAASFLLPISNPSNLVMYGGHLPPLTDWLGRFALPSTLAIGATFLALFLSQRRALSAPIARRIPVPTLARGGRLAAYALAVAAVTLVAASTAGRPLGGPTFGVAALAAALLCAVERRSLPRLLGHLSWSTLPLVAGLFIMVRALGQTSVVDRLAERLGQAGGAGLLDGGQMGVGLVVAVLCNLINNLPAGLLANSVVALAAPPAATVGAMLIGLNLGPNLSVTGSLATLLWLAALRREGEEISAWRFMRLGAVVTLPALLLALAALSLGARL